MNMLSLRTRQPVVLLLPVILMCAAVISCGNNRDEGNDEAALYKEMFSMLTKSGQFSELVDFATPIYYRYQSDSLSDLAADACHGPIRLGGALC